MLPIVVIGAGAAGLMAAIFAATGPRPVLLLERTRDGGRKILISGGGRCNVLPSTLSPTQFITESSPHTLKKMLLAWPLPAQRRFFEHELSLPLVLEHGSGKLFPESNRARDVRDGLVERALRAGVVIRFHSVLRDLKPPADEQLWRVLTDDDPIAAHAVIIATGGLSVPATGSDGAGLHILQRLGHTVHSTYPALTPLTADPPVHAALAGVSLQVTLEAPLGRRRFVTHGGFLFTHRGYSGPAVLNISHHAVRSRTAGADRQPILVQWTERDVNGWDAALRQAGAGQLGPLLRRSLPARLADTLMTEAAVEPQRPLAELHRAERTRIVTLLARYPLPWTGDEGYRKAEVTGGGIALAEVNPHSLESRLHRGLFLCGEVLDAFGPIGGYNFAWAWATGRTAGLGAAASLPLRGKGDPGP
jgi:predicted Rossmann fold flavoprotein